MVRYFLATAEDWLFQVQFLHSSELCILFVQVATAIPCLYIFIYFIPLFFQFVLGDTALGSAVRLRPPPLYCSSRSYDHWSFPSKIQFYALASGGWFSCDNRWSTITQHQLGFQHPQDSRIHSYRCFWRWVFPTGTILGGTGHR